MQHHVSLAGFSDIRLYALFCHTEQHEIRRAYLISVHLSSAAAFIKFKAWFHSMHKKDTASILSLTSPA